MSEHTFRRPIEWKSGDKTDRGAVREINEDALLARDEIKFWAVADGMGGHRVGDLASAMIVDELIKFDGCERLSDCVDEIDAAVLKVNHDIIEHAHTYFSENATMGSTLVSLVIRGQVGVCLWAGDSRLYRLRNNHLSQLTTDHSHVQELLAMGSITPEEVEGHPHANVITRAVGVEEELVVDLNVFNTQMGDVFLLCSDGLHNSVSEQDIVRILGTALEPEEAAEQLVEASLAAGAPDNVSVVVIKGEAGKLDF